MSSDTDQRRFFETEVLNLLERLYGTALRLTHDVPEAEELLARSLAEAWARQGELPARGRFEGWLMRVLASTFVHDWRNRHGHAARAGDEDQEPAPLFANLGQPLQLWWGVPEQSFVNTLRRHDLEDALDGLPDLCRIALVLVELLGFRYAETAALLTVPPSTVRSRVDRGWRMLQGALWLKAQQRRAHRRGSPRFGGERCRDH